MCDKLLLGFGVKHCRLAHHIQKGWLKGCPMSPSNCFSSPTKSSWHLNTSMWQRPLKVGWFQLSIWFHPVSLTKLWFFRDWLLCQAAPRVLFLVLLAHWTCWYLSRMKECFCSMWWFPVRTSYFCVLQQIMHKESLYSFFNCSFFNYLFVNYSFF